MTRTLIAIALFLLIFPALAQGSAEEEKSFFLRFVETRLSAPNRQIRIGDIQGVLSAEATIGTITVADREGVWLRIENATIDWSRTALLLRQRLEISHLAADSIEVMRRPLPEEGMPAPESSSFQVPELPIAVNLEQLEVPSVAFAQDVFGLESELAIEGRLRLEGGSLDTELNIERLDGPGGTLRLAAQYANETETLDLDLSLSEPQDGVVANLLNVEGRPPLALTLSGSGPIGNLDLTLALDADDARVLQGTARLRQRDGGIGFTADLSGEIARLIPALYRDFFGAGTTLTASGVAKEGGGVLLEMLDLSSAALSLEAAAETGADGFLTALSINAGIEDPADDSVVLPVAGGETTIDTARLDITYGEAGSDRWQGSLDLTGLTTGTFSARDLSLDLGGLAQNLNQPQNRRITFDVEGTATGIVAERADVQEALGDTIRLDVAGAWNAGQPVVLERAELFGNGLTVALAGEIGGYAYAGDIDVEASSIAPFSGLAGRDLSGGLRLDSNGTVRPVSGAFDLTLDGEARDLRIGTPAADNLLTGTTTITGRLSRNEEGLEAQQLRIANNQVEMTADGTFATGAADFDFDLALNDLALVSEQAEGRLTATGRAVGSEGVITVTLGAQVPDGSLAGKELRDANIAFEGTIENETIDGSIAGSAFLEGVRADLSSGLRLADGERRLTDFDFSAGGARATGNLTQGADGLFDGAISIDAPNISTAAALFLTEASGSVNADLELAAEDGRQNAEASGEIGELRVDTLRIGRAEFEAAVADLFGVPAIDGNIDAGDLSVAGIDIETLQATADHQGDTTDFSADALLSNDAEISTRGSLTSVEGGYRLALEDASLRSPIADARLVEPATLQVRGRTISFDTITIEAGGGRVTARGEVGDEYDVALTLEELPLAIANAVRPDLELGGTIDGTAQVTGPRDQPQVAFDIDGQRISAAALRQAGLSTLAIEAEGSTSGERLTLDASVSSPEGLRATAEGSVPLGEGAIDLDVDLQAFPLATLNTMVEGQDLGGRVSGSASVSGTLSSPRATFRLNGSGVQAAALSGLGISGLSVTAEGRFADNTVTLSSARASAPQGLTLSANGRVPLSGGGLQVNVSGSAPLSLADRFLADRGATISGTVSLDANVSGSIDNPVIRGSFSTANARAVDPQSNLRLNAISVSGRIDGERVTLENARAALATGGTVSISGSVSTSAQAGFPAELTITLDQARYTDGEIVTATVNGRLTLTGPLTRDPLLSGDIQVERAEITVPESLAGGATAIDVQHVNPPPPVRRTLERARAEDGTPMPSARPSVMRLDIRISAPARVFVRGRGLDAELGGSVRLTGPVTDIHPVGGLELIRGRLSIIGQRITFDEGTITLVGDMDPFLDFTARSQGNDILVFITVRGRVSDLDISFSSQPELPQDEVLARLIFDRGVSELSPLQLAQLAAAAAELAGGSNTSLLNQLRGATGLDDLDIVTDSEGNAAVRAGRYVQENVYLGVEAGAQGTTRGTINLDITEDLKARGSLGSDGNSSLGIFFERDY